MYSDCENFEKVSIEHKGNGHYQITGKVLINHYPESMNRTAYMSGTNQGMKNISCSDAIDLALNPERINLKKTKRKKTYVPDKKKMYEKNKICGICGKKITSFDKATLDHKIPLSKGGLNNRNNYQLAHEECNKEKSNKII